MNNFVLLNSAAAASIAIAAATFSVNDCPEISAEIAIEAALDQFREEKKPASSECENCRGTGKIGDGRVVFDCPVCKGTGKSQCEDGSCKIN